MLRRHATLSLLALLLTTAAFAQEGPPSTSTPLPAVASETPSGGAARPSPAELHQGIQTILARREFQAAREDPFRLWLIRLGLRILGWWSRVFAPFFEDLRVASPVLFWGVVALGFLLLFVLLYHIYVTVRSAFGPARRRRDKPGDLVAHGLHADPERQLAEADRLAQRGDYRLALRHLYLALIRRLDQLALVRYDPSFTNHEYLRQLRSHPETVEQMQPLTRTVDAVWYGGSAAGAEEYQHCRQLALRAWEGAPGHVEA